VVYDPARLEVSPRRKGEDRPDRRQEDGADAPGLGRGRPGRDVTCPDPDGREEGREAAAACRPAILRGMAVIARLQFMQVVGGNHATEFRGQRG